MSWMPWRRSRLITPVAAGAAVAALVAGSLLVGGATLVSADDHAVTVDGFAYNPASIEVNVGDTVTWTNQDAVAHTVTSDDGAFAEPLPGSGGTATITFNTAGTFAYHCSIHPNMHGTVVVLAAAASPTAQPTNTAAPSSTAQPATPTLQPTNTAVPTTTAQPTSTAGPSTTTPPAASATVTRTPSVIAPATGTGPAPATSDAPLFVLLGGMLIALGMGTGMVAFSRIHR